jgi:RNA polymerase sigma-70 factor (ECF subfamily)
MSSDNDLMKAFRDENDGGSFEKLYKKYFPAIASFVYRNWGQISWQDAEDLAAGTFIAVWRAKHQFIADKSFKAWLYKIAVNLKIDFVRRKRIRFEVEADNPEMAKESWAVRERYLSASRRWAVYECLMKLPPSHRAVVELKYFHDLSYWEISHVLNIPVGTVASRLHGGLAKMKQYFERGLTFDHLSLVEVPPREGRINE